MTEAELWVDDPDAPRPARRSNEKGGEDGKEAESVAEVSHVLPYCCMKISERL
jgi:hypothetical protein